MKKITFAALVFLMVVFMVSCNDDTVIENTEVTYNETEPVITGDGYTIYVKEKAPDFKKANMQKKDFGIRIKSYDEGDFYENYDTLLKDTNAKDEYTLEIGGQQLLFKFTKTYEYSNNYTADDGSTLSVNISTGKIRYYYRSGTPDKNSEDITAEQAEQLAKEVIGDLYGSDILDKYVVNEIARRDGCHVCGYPYYAFSCKQYVYGLVWCGSIGVEISTKGDIDSVSKVNTAIYKGIEQEAEQIEKSISKKSLENTLAVLEKYFEGSEWTLQNSNAIVVDASGNYYVRTHIDNGKDEIQICINIK